MSFENVLKLHPLAGQMLYLVDDMSEGGSVLERESGEKLRGDESTDGENKSLLQPRDTAHYYVTQKMYFIGCIKHAHCCRKLANVF